MGGELWEKACDGTGGDVQTREAEGGRSESHGVLSERARGNNVTKRKVASREAQCGVWLLRCVCGPPAASVACAWCKYALCRRADAVKTKHK